MEISITYLEDDLEEDVDDSLDNADDFDADFNDDLEGDLDGVVNVDFEDVDCDDVLLNNNSC